MKEWKNNILNAGKSASCDKMKCRLISTTWLAFDVSYRKSDCGHWGSTSFLGNSAVSFGLTKLQLKQQQLRILLAFDI